MGMASVTKLDSNFIFNHFAMQRQIRMEKENLNKQLEHNEQLIVAGSLDNAEYLQRLTETYPDAKKLLQLNYKREALEAYYDFFLRLEKESPTLNPVEILFGVDEHQMETADSPAVWDMLTIQAGQISDQEADEAQRKLLEAGGKDVQ